MEGKIVVRDLVKRYGPLRAVDGLSFDVEPGRVTGFLGPNGSGKTTTLRVVLGLVGASEGTATIGGTRYADLPEPLATVGAVLEASAAHKGRTGRDHLRVICTAAGFEESRVDEALRAVDLVTAANRKAGEYSLGMRQRLGIAAALLGRPKVLILDEPANGLDPEGIHWLRVFLRGHAKEGRTVLVSSHLLSEMEALADDVVIIAAGKLVAQGSIADVLAKASGKPTVRVRTPSAEALTTALREKDAEVRVGDDGMLFVTGLDLAAVGAVAFASQVELHELSAERADLEGVFLELTQGSAAIR